MQATVQRAQHLLLADGRHSGCVIDGDRLVRRARGSVHMLRRPPAWCFEVALLEQAREAGVSLVAVYDAETHTTYTAPLSALWQMGIRLNRGHGEQLAVPLACWHREDPKQPTLF